MLTRCNKWEIPQIHCKEKFKRTGRFEGADNAESISSAGSSLRMCLPVWPFNAAYICIYMLNWRNEGEFVGGTDFSLVLCLAERHDVGHFTMGWWLPQPHCPCYPFRDGLTQAARGAWGHGSLCSSPPYTASGWCCASHLPPPSTDLSPWGPANCAKTLQGYFPRRKSSVHICSWAPFLLYKRQLWGFSAAFISIGDTEEV